MSLIAKVVSFNTGTGAAASTVTVAHGLGTTPKAVILMWGGRTEAVDAVGAGDTQAGMGWSKGTGASDQWAITATNQHNGAAGTANNCRHVHKLGPCILSVTTGGSVDGEADVQSWDGTNIVFEILNNFAVSLRITALVLSGSDIENVAVGTIALPNDDTVKSVDFTGLGFTPRGNNRSLLLLGTAGDTTTNGTVGQDSTLSLGVATSSSQQGFLAVAGDNLRAAATRSRSITNNQNTHGLFFSDLSGIAVYGHFTSWLSDGFQLQLDDPGTLANAVGYLVLSGPSVAILDGQTGTNNGDDVVLTGAGFSPTAGLVLSAHEVNDTSPGSPGSNGHMVMGAWDGTSQAAHNAFYLNNVATSVAGSAVEHDQCYVVVDNTGAAVTAAMALQSRDANGCTYDMTDGDSSAFQFLTVLVGDAPTAAPEEALVGTIDVARPFIHVPTVQRVGVRSFR